MAPVSLRQAIRVWLRIGLLSFGGPAGQIALMHHEIVEKGRWVSEQRFLHALNYCMLLPGPEAQQLATYLGWLGHRYIGGLLAGLLFILPSLLLLIMLSWLYVVYGQTPVVAGILYGIKPAVAALVMQATWRIGSRVLRQPLMWLLAIGALLATTIYHVSFPYIVLTALVTGWLAGRLQPQWFDQPAHAAPVMSGQNSVHSQLPVWLDDDTLPPAHTRFSLLKTLWIILLGLLLWALPMSLLTLTLGWQHGLTQMGWFFTKAALLTFGGAYAVLPYVYQGAVMHYGWLDRTQMMDGLALGESTPGPLIMIVAFVGFLGGYLTLHDLGNPLLAGIVAAVLVTWFTFLPSFIFIFAGAPLIETTRGKLQFTAPLTAITAAVVGVVASLGWFFLSDVLQVRQAGQGWQALDWLAGLMVLLALYLLIGRGWTVIRVLGLFAGMGLLLRLTGISP